MWLQFMRIRAFGVSVVVCVCVFVCWKVYVCNECMVILSINIYRGVFLWKCTIMQRISHSMVDVVLLYLFADVSSGCRPEISMDNE